MTDRVNHVEAARDLIEGSHAESDIDAAALILAEAQVHATLALVEQQRIANIIALGQPQEVPVRFGSGKATIAMTSWNVDGCLRDDIREALGESDG